MKLVRLIEMFLLACVVSMFIFPIEFTFLPRGLNTKMILGAVGIAAYAFRSINRHEAVFHKTTIVSLLFSMVFSVWCYFAMVANGTPDDSYATYFISFAVWLGGAFAVCEFIRGRHGKLNLQILTQYMAFVCVAQCVLALVMDAYPAFRNLVDTYVFQGQEFLHRVKRLYGIGASLDPAGCKFAVTLVLIAHLISTEERLMKSKFQLALALSAFFIITLIGSMISRTTLAGTALGLGYIFLRRGTTRRGFLSRESMRFYGVFLLILLIVVVYSVIQYHLDPGFRSNIRFAFEAFFNFFERGEFRTDSTDKLNTQMWIWPTNLRDWMIGTGWFGNYVYSTDIGYCRFILYCGLIGFSIFCVFFIYNAFVVLRKFQDSGFVSFLLIVLTFVLWVKVATDIFWVYALLFCLPEESEDSLEAELEE